MKPPITHYKDEPEDTVTNDVLNKELDREAGLLSEESQRNRQQNDSKRVELKVIPVESGKRTDKKGNASNIVNAFRQKMSSSTTGIELPSIGRTLEFRPISTAEQKDLSRVAMENDSRADIMYCAMLSLVNKLAVERGFDVRDYTEFERIAITLNLQQMSRQNPEIRFTCAKCGRENSYRLDTQNLLRRFSKTYRADETVEMPSNGDRKFSFVIGWPAVRNVEDFFKSYYRKYDSASKAGKDTMNSLSQIEYITMFIKSVTVTDSSDPEDKMTANLEELSYGERVQILDCLPQNIVFDDDSGIVSVIISRFINGINDVFRYNDCSFCGAQQSGQMASMTDFLAG